MMIKLIKSTFYDERGTKANLAKFIKSAKQLSFGQECEKFEKNFAKYQGRNYTVFFNSGSSANLALIQALINLGKLKTGDSVGFSAVTWSTNAMPIIQLGLKAVPVDTELETLNISSQKVSQRIKETGLKALFATNLLGFCGDIDKIKDVCDKNEIILLEDNCESLGTVYKGKKLGNFGLAGTFSFYVGHHMSTVEGGAVCTNDKKLSEMLRVVRAHGWDRNLNKTEQTQWRTSHAVSDFYGQYTFYDLGYNFRPTEINGFLGNQELKNIKTITKERNRNFIKLASPIYKEKDKYLPIKFDHIDFVSNFAVPVLCRTKKIHDQTIAKCRNQIEIRPIVAGNIANQPFFGKYDRNSWDHPNADFIHQNGFYFGNNPHLTKKEIEKIITTLTNQI